jgi:hypothetical protein
MHALFSFLFKGEVRHAKTVLRGSTPNPQGDVTNGVEALRFKLVYFFSWVLSIVLVVCLFGAIVFKLKGIADTFLPPIITGVIGYFGGAIAAYFGVRTA